MKGDVPLHSQMHEIYLQMINEGGNSLRCNYGYMKKQSDINEKMRAVLIDWLVDVHLKFKLRSETLFLTVYIIDKFLNIRVIQKNTLQLVGISCLIIACKYEEIYTPEVTDFIYITDNTYTKEEILAMERDILSTLSFDITIPSILKFYDLLCLNFALTEMEYYLGRYILDLFLLDYRINKYSHSVIACRVIYLVMKFRNYQNYHQIKSYTLYPDEELKKCAEEIYNLITNFTNCNLYAVINKYSTKEFFEVSKLYLF
jgi:cyclin B